MEETTKKEIAFPVVVERNYESEEKNEVFLTKIEDSLEDILDEWTRMKLGPIPGKNIDVLTDLVLNPESIIKEAVWLDVKDEIPGSDRYGIDKNKYLSIIELPAGTKLKALCAGLRNHTANFKSFDRQRRFTLGRYFAYDPQSNKLTRKQSAWDEYIAQHSFTLYDADDEMTYEALDLLSLVLNSIQFPAGGNLRTYLDFIPDDSTQKWRLSPVKFPVVKEKLQARGVMKMQREINKLWDQPSALARPIED